MKTSIMLATARQNRTQLNDFVRGILATFSAADYRKFTYGPDEEIQCGIIDVDTEPDAFFPTALLPLMLINKALLDHKQAAVTAIKIRMPEYAVGTIRREVSEVYCGRVALEYHSQSTIGRDTSPVLSAAVLPWFELTCTPMALGPLITALLSVWSKEKSVVDLISAIAINATIEPTD